MVFSHSDVSRHEKTFEKVLSGRNDANIHFSELCSLLLALGFVERTRGSHHMFGMAGIAMNKYEIIIFWSDEDTAFVADVPELPGCMAHGSSHAEALANAQEAVELWIQTARDLGRSVPEPKGRRLLYA